MDRINEKNWKYLEQDRWAKMRFEILRLEQDYRYKFYKSVVRIIDFRSFNPLRDR